MRFLAVLLALAVSSRQQTMLTSPCPEVLSYEAPEEDRWYATITLPPGSRRWLFLIITLDTKADFLGNWEGEVITQDNTNFKIDNPDLNKVPKPIRIFVKHDRYTTAPKVQVIRLGNREICNVDNPTITEVETQPPPPNVNAAPPPNVNAAPPPTNNQNSPPHIGNNQNFPRSPVPGSNNGNKRFHTPSVRIPINFYGNTDGNQQCGTVLLNNPVGLVRNGAPTQEGQWPWQIALYRTENVDHFYSCGGTLVTTKHVVTAAHCTTDSNYYPVQKLHVSVLTVYLGKHNLITSLLGVQIRFVEQIKVHSEYNPRLFSRDLSILVLQEPVQYTEWVQPACLWPEHLSDLSNIVGKKGSVVGWGDDGSGKLQLVLMPVVDDLTCIRSKSDFFGRFTSNYTFCAGSRDGQTACNGDSGGGMMFNLDGSWYLRGLVSISPPKNNEAVCDPSHFVVFTDIAQFLPWVKENILD